MPVVRCSPFWDITSCILVLLYRRFGTDYRFILQESRSPTFLTAKVKGKVRPRTGHEGPDGEHKHISALSLTSAVGVGGRSTTGWGRFAPAKVKR